MRRRSRQPKDRKELRQDSQTQKINPAVKLQDEVKSTNEAGESAAVTESEQTKQRYPSVREFITAVKQYLEKRPFLSKRAPEEEQATLDLLREQYHKNQITQHQVTLGALQTAVIRLCRAIAVESAADIDNWTSDASQRCFQVWLGMRAHRCAIA